MYQENIKDMIKQQLKELTKAEEQVMQVLWELGEGFVNDIIEKMPEPKPAYNTVSTIVRILKTKAYVGHRAFGKSHQYYPLVTKEEYSERSLSILVNGYFDNSYHNLVSFFTKKSKVSLNDLEEMKRMIDEEIAAKKEGSHE